MLERQREGIARAKAAGEVATPARMVSMSLLVGLRASSRSPPHGQDPRPMPRFDRSASMARNSAPAAFRPRSCAVSPAAQVDYGISREIVAPLTL